MARKKAQSALEYMMTYGWAILIIVIVAAVLYSLGIFSPSSSAGTTSSGFAPFVVLGQECNANGLYIELGNNAGNTVTFYNVTVTTSTGASVFSNFVNLSTPITVVNGGNAVLTISGLTCSGVGSRYSASVSIGYKIQTSLGTESAVSSGTVSGTSVVGTIIATGASSSGFNTTTFSISTSQSNQIILITANGYPVTSPPTPTVTVDGNPATELKLAFAKQGSSAGPAASSIFYYVAPSSGPHTISVADTGYKNGGSGSDIWPINFAVTLVGASSSGVSSSYAVFNPGSPQSMTVKTTVPNEIVFSTALLNLGSAGVPADFAWTTNASNSFTLINTSKTGTGILSSDAYVVIGAPGTYSIGFTYSAGDTGNSSMVVATFQPAAP